MGNFFNSSSEPEENVKKKYYDNCASCNNNQFVIPIHYDGLEYELTEEDKDKIQKGELKMGGELPKEANPKWLYCKNCKKDF